ncbi:MAG: serine hydrolase, partial [Bacteroidota bacterium]
GILSSVHDMAKWDAALYSDKLLPSKAKSLMWTPVQLPDGTPTTLSWGDNVDYGMGWEVLSYRGRRLQTHSGQTAGFVAQYMRFPEQQISIVAFINLYDMGAWLAARAMADFVVPGLE